MYLPRMDFVTRVPGLQDVSAGRWKKLCQEAQVPGESGVRCRLGWGGDGAAQILEIPARLRPARSCSWAKVGP